MTWESFQTTAEYILSKEFDIFDGQTLIQDVKIVEAKRRMKNDLEAALGVLSTDTVFESLLDTRTEMLRQALSLMQLHLYFQERSGEPYSTTSIKSQYYSQQYEMMRSSFKNLNETISKQTHNVRIMR